MSNPTNLSTALKTGARHSAQDQKLIQEIHDKALELGAMSPQAEPKAGYMDAKSVDLDAWTDKVRRAFAELFPTSPYVGGTDIWCEHVWDDHIRARVGDKLYSIPYTLDASSEVQFAAADAWREVELVEQFKALDDVLVTFGGAVKAIKQDGDLLHVGGYLVLFGDENNTDVSEMRDFFTPETDFGKAAKSHTWFHHTLPIQFVGADGKKKQARITREFPITELSKDEVGIFAKSVLDERDDYEKMVAGLVRAGKLGYSSGTAAHLIKRTEMPNGAHRIDRWLLGDDASYTHTPAEPRTHVLNLKSLQTLLVELPEAEPKVANDVRSGDAASTVAVTDSSQKTLAAGTTPAKNEVREMTPEEKQELLAEMKSIMAEGTKLAIETNKQALDAAIAALKAEPPTTPAGGVKTQGNGQHKTPLGDDPFKAFGWYLKSGDASGIRTGEAYDEMLEMKHLDALKTTYALLESTQYQGQEAVPTEVVARIIEKRDPISIMRAAGVVGLPVGSNAVTLPIEKAAPEEFVITTVDNSATFDQTTVQPLDKLSATVYLFTRTVPIDMQLLEDSVFGIEAWWSRRLARAWGITENKYFLVGTGTGQPQGAITGGTLGVTAAAAAAVTAAEIVDLYHKLPAEYRDNVAWAMRGATEGAIRKLTVSTQFPFVGQGGDNGGVGDTGLAQGTGWLVNPRSKVYNSDAVDALAASKKPVVIGNFEAGYAIFERKGLTVFRDPYTRSKYGMVEIHAFFREAGGVQNADAIRYLATPSA